MSNEVFMAREISYNEALLAEKDGVITALRAENERLLEDLIEAEKYNGYHQQACLEIERLRAVLDLYREAVRIDVTMEGPKFMGSNVSALKRAWDADRAALEGREPLIK